MPLRADSFASPHPITKPPTTTEAALQRASEEMTILAREYLDRIAGGAQELGIPMQMVTVGGRPHYQIIQYAEANQVDLIVMCTRGQSGLGRWLLGSVSDRVVRGANVPVLMVRGQKMESLKSS